MTNSKICELINENTFKEILTNELYALIDEEISKGDEMDCDLIDELVLAIESLDQTEDENKAIVFPIIFGDAAGFSKRVINKVNNRNRIMQLTAWAAVIALLCSGANELLLRSENTTLVNEISKMVQKMGEFLTNSFNTDKDVNKDGNTEESTTSTFIDEATTLPKDDEIELPEEVTLVELELIISESFKRSYLWQEKLNLEGLSVIAVYSNGARTSVDINKCKITGFDSLKIGKQTITIEYKGFKTTFEVTVSRTEQNDEGTRTITNIECDMTGKDIIVPKGTANPAVYKNVKYRYVYSDGTFSRWSTCEDATLVSDYNSELLDETQVLTYRAPNGMEFTINVIVYDNTVTSDRTVLKLEILNIPQAMKCYANDSKKYYMYVDDECDFSQFKIKIYYKNATEITTLGDNKIKAFGTMSTERPSPYGGYTITFAYGDITTTFNYEVVIKPEVHTYTLNTGIWECYYIKDAPEEYGAKSIVKAKMNDSNNEVYLDVEVRGYDPNKLGFIELELYYEGEYLCDYIGGYIYGDTGFAITERPVTEYITGAGFNFRPYVKAAKCVGGGKFQTYSAISSGNYPNQYFESSATAEMKAMGITRYGGHSVPTATVYYTISADMVITEFGTYEAEIYLYNVSTNDNGWTYQRDSIAEDFSYTVTIKEKPSFYRVEAPRNLKINIQDIYTDFYDQIHVYAVFADGREEEIFDYDITRYLPSKPTTSSRLTFYVEFPDSNNGTYLYAYVYSEGYEDSFYITVQDNRKTYDNYYAVGTETPSILVNFASASQTQIQSFSIYKNSNISSDVIEVIGWDTSTVGEKTATIIYHSPIGDLKTTYKYVVIPEYLTETCSIVFNDESYAYDCRYGLIDGTYKVIHTDKVGRTYEITDYIVAYQTNITGFGIPTISYYNPHPLANADSSNPRQDVYTPQMKIVGACDNLQAEWLDDGTIKLSIDCPYLPENGTMLFRFGYPAEKGQYGSVMKYVEASTPEVIITLDMLRPDLNNAYFYIYAYIVDENGTMYRTYSGKIDSFPLNK